ncbi:tRNA (adenosine(37)-N6)-dimethylallyltransferase MiaA [Parafrigoribacterium mesophilum]|uniref:tRNA (adenosine(37)-N6)-dimethylallyltransferase MiaA n=1 Tax=Parafrigoribacterium mesophilum TaxID=433646 RepID=UPI0031FCBFE8
MLVAVVGATGTGKSDLSLDLAEALAAHGEAAEIVNADAMQLYRGMDIGTAKLPVAARRGIPHHLFDVLEVSEDASVARYQDAARKAVQDILDRGAVPILVGGSGLYVSSVLYDFRFPGTDAAVRGRLEAELAAHGTAALYDRLAAVDPVAAEAIGPHNGRRIVRALEVVELTGAPFGAGLPAQTSTWMPTTILGLRAPRAELVARLDDRVRGMWRAGLVEEVRSLLPRGIEQAGTAGRAIGYAQAIAQLAGRVEEAEAIALTAALTRRYARRQVGWFRREKLTTWLDYDDPERISRAVQLVLSNG